MSTETQTQVPASEATNQSVKTGTTLNATIALWASAMVLAALVVVQASRLLPAFSSPGFDPASLLESQARADVVSQIGQYAIATVEISGSEDLTIVLDSRGEDVLVYTIKNGQRIELIGRESLRQIFADARALGSGRGPR
ncbi:MAG: hypothetical protein KF745_12225 [Phycisphaeraceae bacterium]|nr:hypothetical protein [Phycisphaeraceae bacterium]